MGKFYARLGEELSLYVKYSAWLHTAPKEDTKAISSTSKTRPVTRLQKLEADGMVPEYPPLPAPHIIEYLHEVGPVVPSGMGMLPISWQDLTAWQFNTGIEVEAWESRLLRRLSLEYLAQTAASEDPACPSPWADTTPTEVNRAAVDRKVRSAFGGFMARMNKGTKP